MRCFTALLAAALALVLAPGAEAATKLRVTTQLPLSSPLGRNLVAFKERVEAASGGDIQIEIYPAAQLFTDKEVPAAVASGQIDMGSASLSRFSGTIPAVDVFSVPFLFNSRALVEAAVAPGSAVRAPLDAALTAKGARPLWWQPYGFAQMFMKGRVVRRPEDLKGLKIRTFGKAMEIFINAIGGAAVNISGSRQYLAYERGTVDGGMTGLIGVKERKLYQVLDTLIITNHTNLEFPVIINERVWRRLTDGQRRIVGEAARAVEIEMRASFADEERESYELARDNGMEIYHLNAEEIAAWRTATAHLEEAYIEAAGPLGAELVAAAKRLRAELGQ